MLSELQQLDFSEFVLLFETITDEDDTFYVYDSTTEEYMPNEVLVLKEFKGDYKAFHQLVGKRLDRN